MARRTKADAEATRNHLLDAAEVLFQAQGVSGTSLQNIALAAGTTRGAIYWHFRDKADLFNAMMDRATLPLECGFPDPEQPASQLADPLEAMRAGMNHVLHLIATDKQLRRVFEIATHQVEYNSEMAAVRERHLQNRAQYLALTLANMAAAADRAGLVLPVPVRSASLGLHIVIDGLLHNWLLDPSAFDLESVGQQTVDTYLRGLGFSLAADRAGAPCPLASLPGTATAGAGQPVPADSPRQARSRTRTA
ncbi:MAG: TetR family transcriptional regulator [Burkholderiaceae bacterium]